MWTKKETKSCEMRKAHWWDHITITNKTFDCLICNQGQGRAKRVFTPRFISQVHLPSSVIKKSRILSEICTFVWQGKSCIWKRRRWSVWAISLFLFLWRDSDWCNRAPVLKDTNDAVFSSHPLTHIALQFVSSFFSFYVMTSLHIRKQLYHIESPMATSWHIHSACNFGMVHLT